MVYIIVEERKKIEGSGLNQIEELGQPVGMDRSQVVLLMIHPSIWHMLTDRQWSRDQILFWIQQRVENYHGFK